MSNDDDRDDVPIYVWQVGHTGASHALAIGSPKLPATSWTIGDRTAALGRSTFRFRAVPYRGGFLVAGESLAEVARVGSSLFDVEAAAGAVLLVLMYLAAYFVGVRAMSPVALARRRQAEFTSDASHELRTPLSVIEAEVDLALSRPRDAESYRSALRRVGDEGRRLHRIVEDLLWLARSDETRRVVAPSNTCDLAEVAAAAETRFEPLASRNGVALEFVGPNVAATVRADAEAIDRLVGVLVDNACKFAGPGGRARVSVQLIGHRRVLTVEDSGPGIQLLTTAISSSIVSTAPTHRPRAPASGSQSPMRSSLRPMRTESWVRAHWAARSSRSVGVTFHKKMRIMATS